MRPFAAEHLNGAGSRVDLSFLLERPAGRSGFVAVRDGRLVRGDGSRLRLWGVNITDWSSGSTMLPSHEEARRYAAALARLGVNCARLHFLDLLAPRGIIDSSRDDTRAFEPEQLDRLDYWVAQLKAHGVYSDLNLVVGRSYKAGDGVREHEEVGWAKALTFFDPRLIELQREYATELLTRRNPYTGAEYRHEPAIAIVELVNENSLVEAWLRGRLHPAASPSDDPNWRAIPASYAAQLDERYQAYLAGLPAAELARIREQAGAGGDAPVPRLRPAELAAAPLERFHAEAAFYMGLEREYYRQMREFLREELGVRAPLIGSSDHAHDLSGYGMLWANAALDIIDGHVYWQPPAEERQNTPMVNDPLGSTVVQLSRTAMAGAPYLVSEVNHPLPHDWACEGIPALAAYGRLQDWDGMLWYTFEPKLDPATARAGDPFDLSLDPVKTAQLAAGALLFLRGDVSPAQATVERSYSLEQVRESLRLPPAAAPYFTPGFPLALPLLRRVRVGSLEGPPTAPHQPAPPGPLVADTGELAWHIAPDGRGLITVDAPASQALIGFVASGPAVRHMAAELANAFCAITLSALDGRPIASAARLLLTAGARVEASEAGGAAYLIEPVRGRLVLRGLEGATGVQLQPLDGAGRPLGAPRPAEWAGEGWALDLGEPATTWYEIGVRREA
jgi:hypothetical protein